MQYKIGLSPQKVSEGGLSGGENRLLPVLPEDPADLLNIGGISLYELDSVLWSVETGTMTDD
jgi:hypothetical protein